MDHDPEPGKRAPKSPEASVVRKAVRPILLQDGIGAILVVRGRRTGAPVRVPLVPLLMDGALYLLAIYGTTDWVRNLRAAGSAELIRQGRTEAFTAVEIGGDERDRVMATFRAGASKAFQRDFDLRREATDHPAFRLEPTEPE